MADTKHELEIVARLRDMVSPSAKSMASGTRRAFDDIERGASRASTAMERLGRGFGGEKMGRGIAMTSGALLQLGGIAESAAGQMAGAFGRIASMGGRGGRWAVATDTRTRA